MRAVTASEMMEIDRRAGEEYGIPGIVLMENAGLAVFHAASEMLGTPRRKVVVVLAGRGNNGGDGLVAARHLHLAGAYVKVILMGSRESYSGDSGLNLDIWLKLGQKVSEIDDRNALQVIQLALMQADLVVDAIYGTGFHGALRDRTKRAVELVNGSDKPVLAVDLPSGIEADTGCVNGVCVRASRTVTFGLLKPGLLLDPGATFTGQVEVAGISLPPDLLAAEEGRFFLTDALVAGWVRPREPEAHKGHFGHVLIVAGSRGMTGAACLAAGGALRSGAGLVTLALPESQQSVAAGLLPEVITLPLPETPEGTLAIAARDLLFERVQHYAAVAVGPGLTLHPETQEVIRATVVNAGIPCIVDADGLNACAGMPETLKYAKGELILTPHPGEMGRLTGMTPQKVQEQRLELAERTAADWGCVTVLKGARTIVAGPRATYINGTGNPGMATGGSGDVLTGIIAGLVAQGLDPLRAAAAAVFMHGRAGDEAALVRGQRGLTAGDILECLPGVIKSLEQRGMQE